jgi:GTP-binding protein
MRDGNVSEGPMFVDRVRIEVVAGDGGRGSGSFRREKYIPRGGPDGGDGGAGGSVILRAAAGIDSLAALAHRNQWRAGHGEPGGPANCHGRSAEDLVLQVPAGTIVTDEHSGLVLKDLASAGDWIVAALGGTGGFGNVHFKTSTNRAPRTTTPGGKGEARRLALELKVIADVGLVGLPNAGKSTLLSRLSRARPQIADYAFTTKSPMLGIVAVDRDRSFVLADLPGLIEGAHAGTGLGHEFLRHVERAGILVHVVEPAPIDGSDPVANHRTIRAELAAYDPVLATRPEITIVSKAELPTAAEVRDRLEAEVGRPVIAVSAVTGMGLDLLVRAVVRELDRPRDAAAKPQPPAAPQPAVPPQPAMQLEAPVDLEAPVEPDRP